MQDRHRLFARLSVALLLLAGIVVFGWAGTHQAQAQTAGDTAGDLPRTITVVGEGTVKVQPGVARANVGVEITNASLQKASQAAADTMDAVIEAIKDQGVATKDVQTSDYNINIDRPAREPGLAGDEAGSEPVYRVRNIVAVTVRDLDSVGRVLDAAVQAGANSLFGVNFSVSDPEPAQAEARRQAVQHARDKAEALAELHGAAVGEVVSISEVIGGGFTPGRFQAEAAAPVGGGAGPIAPGELEVSTRLQVVYALVSETAATRESEAGGATREETVREMTPTPTPASEGSTSSSSVTTVEESTVAEVPRLQKTGPAEVNVVGGNEATLRRFLKRWLAPSYAGGPTQVTALIGALPDDLPFDLPVLKNTTVVGALIRQDENPSTQLLLDTELPAGEAIDALTETLREQGFTPSQQYQGPGSVFQTAGPREYTRFCSPDNATGVTFSAFEVAGGMTNLTLNVMADEGSGPCQGPKAPERDRLTDRLPRLSPPENAMVRSSGSSLGSDFVEANAELTSDLSVEALTEHYQSQLTDAGWEKIDASQADAVAWSAWSFTDDGGNDWTATFYLVQRGSEAGQYLATLRAEQQ